MFDKIKFSQILKNINETYDSQRDFSKKSGINRTYLSQYMNLKLKDPPKPKILEKLSQSSHGVTTYEELMNVCGYININEKHNSIPVYAKNDKKNRKINFLIDLTKSNNLSSVESKAFNELANNLIDCLKNDRKIDINQILNNKNHLYNNLSSIEKNNVLQYLNPLIAEMKYVETEYGNPLNSILLSGLQQTIIPILGTVKAGYDYLAQENIIGTIDVETSLVGNGEEYFALKVKGDSMFPVLVEDDIVIIKKQDDFETGDIVVALINGDEATIKKGKKSSNSILLQPFNTNYEPLVFTYDEMQTIPVKIIGIVKQLKREF